MNERKGRPYFYFGNFFYVDRRERQAPEVVSVGACAAWNTRTFFVRALRQLCFVKRCFGSWGKTPTFFVRALGQLCFVKVFWLMGAWSEILPVRPQRAHKRKSLLLTT